MTDNTPPEERVLSVLDNISKRERGFTPSIFVLVTFCLVLVWFGGNKLDEYVNKSLDYNENMIKLVSVIQADLQSSNEDNRNFRMMIMRTVNENTRMITRVATIIDDAGLLPIYTDSANRTYIQGKKTTKEKGE